MRKFTPYEINQLIKFGFDPFKIATEVDENIPIEYITGKAEFRNEFFEINKNVLIPRVETQAIIDIGLDWVKERAKKYDKVTFADVGTGSGAIGISFALELEKLVIPYNGYISDNSLPAIEIARSNIEELLVKRKVNCFTYQKEESSFKIIESDLLNDYPKKIKFDIIFANLPYIPSSRISELDTSVKDFEPIQALDGGEDGLELIRKLLKQAESYLTDNGRVILEVDDSHIKEKTLEFDKWNIVVLNDQFERVRFWVCTLK